MGNWHGYDSETADLGGSDEDISEQYAAGESACDLACDIRHYQVLSPAIICSCTYTPYPQSIPLLHCEIWKYY